jgi:hypothetical protein
MDFGQAQEHSTHMLTSIQIISKTEPSSMTCKTIGHPNPMMTKKLIGFGHMNMTSMEKILPTSSKFIFLTNMRELLQSNSNRHTSKQSLTIIKLSMSENLIPVEHHLSPKETAKEIFLFQRINFPRLLVFQVRISS